MCPETDINPFLPYPTTDGQGTFYWRNGASWQGTFNRGKPVGRGQHYCPATGEIISDVWSGPLYCCRSCPDAFVLMQRVMRSISIS